MKFRVWSTALVLIAAANAPTGCKRHTPLPPGAVAFTGAGVALVPGEHWKAVRNGELARGHYVCLPVLEGEGENQDSVDSILDTDPALGYRSYGLPRDGT